MQRLALICLLACASTPARAEDAADKSPLALAVRLSKASVVPGAPITFEVTFTNRGTAPMQVLVGRHTAEEVFPSWRFTHESGAEYVAYNESAARMMSDGLLGRLVALPPGEQETFTYTRKLFLRLDPETGRSIWGDPAPMPPGKVTVVARYRHTKRTVPYHVRAERRVEERTVEGLFVGRVASPPATLTITPRTSPFLQITAPKVAVEGQPFAVEVTVHNPTKQALRHPGAFRVFVGRKGRPAGEARGVVSKAGAWVQGAPEAPPLDVPAGGTRVVRVELRDLKLTPTSEARPAEGQAFYPFVKRCWFYVRVHWDAANLESNGLYRPCKPPATADAPK